VAEEISRFYRNYMTNPLRHDIARGADDKALSKYFNLEESRRSLRVRDEFGPEKMYEEDKKMANELLARLTKVSAESALQELDGILRAHFDASEDHMTEYKPTSREEGGRACNHRSELFWLACNRSTSSTETYAVLRPTRGTNLMHWWYHEVQIPEYYVKRVEAQ